MIHVQEIDLNPLGLKIPSGNVGVVMMQPFLRLTDVEPYRCRDEARQEQLNAIARTIEIARSADHGAEITHFTLFPEYSIPGLEGVALIENEIKKDSWRRGTVVIGGTDALDLDAYAELCAAAGTTVDSDRNGPDKVPTGKWINCCITWVKAANGDVRRWLQPKLAPARPELQIEHQPMYRGKSVFLFRCSFDNNAICRFFSLVCFDWIGHDDGQKILHRVLGELNARQIGQLNWVFVIQHNENPSQTGTFLTGVYEFFIAQDQFPSVRREHACLVFPNTAGKAVPGRADRFGASSVIFSPIASVSVGGACHHTYSGLPTRLRGTDMLKRCKDVLFRERGACIHSFSQRVPAFLALDAGDFTLPLPTALVHPLTLGAPVDPRAAGLYVPGCVKWVNDELDTLPCLSQNFGHAPLAPQLPTAHSANIAVIRSLDSQQLDRRVNDATWFPPPAPGQPAPDRNADVWDATETAALENMVHTLDIVRLGFPNLDLTATAAHGTLTTGAQVVDVLAVRGESHAQCLAHANRIARPARHKLLLVSCDQFNRPIHPKDGKIYMPSGTGSGGEPKITDVESGMKRMGFSELLDLFEQATSQQLLQESLNARIAV